MADIRNLILAVDSEKAELAAALEEARQVITDLRLQNETLTARLKDALANGSQQQTDIDALTTKITENRARIRAFLLESVRVA